MAFFVSGTFLGRKLIGCPKGGKETVRYLPYYCSVLIDGAAADKAKDHGDHCKYKENVNQVAAERSDKGSEKPADNKNNGDDI